MSKIGITLMNLRQKEEGILGIPGDVREEEGWGSQMKTKTTSLMALRFKGEKMHEILEVEGGEEGVIITGRRGQ
jgi:hypothetical protein